MNVRKSPRDDKQYRFAARVMKLLLALCMILFNFPRVVKLDNGLVALLIEDHTGQKKAKKKSSMNILTAASSSKDDTESSFDSREDSDMILSSGDGISGGGAESDEEPEGNTEDGARCASSEEDVDGVKRKIKAKRGDVDPDDMSVCDCSYVYIYTHT